MRKLVFLLAATMIWLLTGTAFAADGRDHGLHITTLSTRPDTVSRGDVLVRIDGRTSAGVHFLLKNQDVSGEFQRQADGSLMGLLSGLNFGRNDLVASTQGPRGAPNGG